MYSKSYGVFCITESWLSKSISSAEILPYNYTIYRYDKESRGGGVLIAVANSIASRQIHHHFNIEIVTVELTQANITVSCLYVPPNHLWGF